MHEKIQTGFSWVDSLSSTTEVLKNEPVKQWHKLQQHLSSLAKLLNVEILILNEMGLCVCATGLFKKGIGHTIPEDNAIAYSLRSEKSIMVVDPGEDAVCQVCSKKGQCADMANFTGPVHVSGKLVAVIQIVAFTTTQRTDLLIKAEDAFALIKHMVSFIWQHEIQEISQQEVRTKQALFPGIIGESPSMQKIKSTILKIAAHESTVLIQGESGTGKELVAYAIHKNSKRSTGAFVPINCGAIPENLIESELFGYESGAFSGAKKEGQKGLIEHAHGGTLFLDEVSEMPLLLQVKLLRVLQEKSIRRVGGRINQPIDIRIIAASNKNLAELVRQENFREDLYFRLDVIPFHIAPLRERKGDIRLLTMHYLHFFSKKQHCTYRMTTELLHYFEEYSWIGNVRELKNFVEYGISLCDKNILTLELMLPRFTAALGLQKTHTEDAFTQDSSTQPASQNIPQNEVAYASKQLQQATFSKAQLPSHSPRREAIEKMLTEHGRTTKGKRKIAELLHISLATLYRRLREIS